MAVNYPKYNFMGFSCNAVPVQKIFHETHPSLDVDPGVEKILSQLAVNFVEKVTEGSCQLAAHRKDDVLDVADLALFLDKQCNIDLFEVTDEYYFSPVGPRKEYIDYPKTKRRRRNTIKPKPTKKISPSTSKKSNGRKRKVTH